MAKAKKTADPELVDSFVEKDLSGKQSKAKGFEYPLYDLWKVDVSNLKKDEDDNAKQVKFTCIKLVRSSVKLEHNAAESLNKQSHNSQRRYYAAGQVTNGHEETITLN